MLEISKLFSPALSCFEFVFVFELLKSSLYLCRKYTTKSEQTKQRSVKYNKMLSVITKMTSHCAGTVQMREKSESGIRK